MADNSQWLASRIHLLYKFTCLGLHAQRISIQRASWQHNGIEIMRISLIQCHVNFKYIGLLVMIDACDLARHWRDKCNLSTSMLQCLLWLGHLDLFEVISNQHSNT